MTGIFLNTMALDGALVWSFLLLMLTVYAAGGFKNDRKNRFSWLIKAVISACGSYAGFIIALFQAEKNIALWQTSYGQFILDLGTMAILLPSLISLLYASNRFAEARFKYKQEFAVAGMNAGFAVGLDIFRLSERIQKIKSLEWLKEDNI